MTHDHTHPYQPETDGRTSNGHDKSGNEAKAKAAEFADMAKEKTQDLRETVEKTMEDGARVAEDAVARAQNNMRVASRGATDAVRENPGLALAGALGFGVLLGLALARRS